jgi:hypothetical protein
MEDGTGLRRSRTGIAAFIRGQQISGIAEPGDFGVKLFDD